MANVNVLTVCGSLRRGSYNAMVQRALPSLAPEGMNLKPAPSFAEFPLYNFDIQSSTGFPAPVHALAEAIRSADGVIFCTPEYNFGIPGGLKNAIDWLSRPFGDGALNDKPLAVIGGAMGRYGGVWAHDETRKSFGIAGARVIDAIKLSVPLQTLGGNAVAENAELSANVRDAVGKLVAEVG
jgi:NAD(P)H-dependent FMN reductase